MNEAVPAAIEQQLPASDVEHVAALAGIASAGTLEDDCPSCQPPESWRKRGRRLFLPTIRFWIVAPNQRSESRWLRGPSPLGCAVLPTLGAMIPPELSVNGVRYRTRVEYIDEMARGPLNPDKVTRTWTARRASIHVFAFSFFVQQVARAIDLSDRVRRSAASTGKKTVLLCGGYGPSSVPEIVRPHFDATHVGDIDRDGMERLLTGLLEGRLAEKVVTALSRKPDPIHEPQKLRGMRNNALTVALRTSVGCPQRCSFCTAFHLSGFHRRGACLRCIKQTLQQIPRLLIFWRRVLALVDDNFLQGSSGGSVLSMMETARVIHESGYRFITELTPKTLIESQQKIDRYYAEWKEKGVLADLPGARNRQAWENVMTILDESDCSGDLYRFLGKNGTLGLFLGVETLCPERPAGLKKWVSPDDLGQLVETCHRNGIDVIPAFILGLDDYDMNTVDRTLAWLEKYKIDGMQASIRVPVPMSEEFVESVREGWLLSSDWSLFDGSRVVAHYPSWSVDTFETLEEELQRLYDGFYNRRSIRERLGGRRDKAAQTARFVNTVIWRGRPAFLRHWRSRKRLTNTEDDPLDETLRQRILSEDPHDVSGMVQLLD